MSAVERIDEEIANKSLLKHPFYKAWSEGKLELSELSGYSKEYFQLVKRVPVLVENVRSHTDNPELYRNISQNLLEESEHIAPWIRFAKSLGISEDELSRCSGSEGTNEAVSQLASLTNLSFEEAVAAMYAYEMELPKISRSKIDGLKMFYGLTSHDATHYFEIHEVADVKHAELWRSILRKIPEDKIEKVVSAARISLEAQNRLLDSVMNGYCK
ncbi:MAG: iron-containing redox enzyme family protein [Nitrososphaerota archaeon]|nr:iron-containing redox enzyme family protein [Nitrososphaerota archaeon]MDG6924095.1 iron-containing redox enzyme family protein [Nitrososphaerota archaeon]